MATRDVKTYNQDTICDVCGRTLLRGERAEVYLNGGARRAVCELCKTRALHEGWIREGTMPAYEDTDAVPDRRRSLLGRLRARREPPTPAITLRDELDNSSWSQDGGAQVEMPPHARSSAPRQPTRQPPRQPPRQPSRQPLHDPVREPRHVHAVPTSVEQKIVSAIERFNGSEHRRTVAGVARSLGAPDVSAQPSPASPSLVHVVVSWELCWYRYEVDLSDDQPIVRVAGQGYELDELTAAERTPNAIADEQGSLRLA